MRALFICFFLVIFFSFELLVFGSGKKLLKRSNCSVAQCKLGVMFEQDCELLHDDIEVVRHDDKDAALKNPNAQSILDRTYEETGEVLTADSEATQFYYNAAALGNADEQFRLGRMYEQGRGGFPISNALAALWYGKAAKQGHAEALVNYTRMCDESCGWPI